MADMAFELLHEQRRPLGATTLVADRVFDRDLIKDGAILQSDCDGITDGTFLWVMVIHAEALVFNASNLCA